MDCFAVGGDLSIERLLLAYKMEYFHGIVREKKLCGGVPVNALLFFRNEIHISHSMKKYIKKYQPSIKINRDFADTIASLPNKKRV